MTYDCFTFFNELDLLEIRLNVLKDVVDRFVLVEARQTYSGKDKPLYFAENRGRFAVFEDRIIHLVVESFPEGGDSWLRENLQRNFIAEGLKDCRDDDLILISDLDEIPDPRIFPIRLEPDEICLLEQNMYYYFLNYRDRGDPVWMSGTKALSYRTFRHGLDSVDVPYSTYLPESVNRGTTASKIRMYRSCRHISNGGWHFSFLGGVDAIVRKLQSFSHQEYNTEEFLDRSRLLDCLERGRDIFGRSDKIFVPEPLKRNLFPDHVIDSRAKYEHLVLTVRGTNRWRVWANEIRLFCRPLGVALKGGRRLLRKVHGVIVGRS